MSSGSASAPERAPAEPRLDPVAQREWPLLAAIGRRRDAADPRLTRAIVGFSRAGEYGALWFAIGAAGAACDRPLRGDWLRAIATTGAAFAANVAIKHMVRRPRPPSPGLVAPPTALSFPSSHAATSFAAAAAYRRILAAGGRPRVARSIRPLAIAMAATRLYVGVHYPSDIVAGALLGTGAARLGHPSGRRGGP